MPVIEIFCDGSCVNGNGGWGAVLRFGTRKKEFSGRIPVPTTSQRAELIAFIEAFNQIKDRSHGIHVYTDSQYLQKGMSEWIAEWAKRDWRASNKKPVKNQDLWKEILMISNGCNISWHWVRGHAGHPEQERADKLALREARKI
jgi:ribonuclease HI